MSNTQLTAQQAAAQELLRRQAALQNMWDYREYIAPSGELDFRFEPAAHHDLIIDALHFLEYGETHDGTPVRRVLVMLPPGSAKSTYGSVQFATWYAARNPTHNILACSNTTDLAENFNRRRRNVCHSREWQTLAETKIDANNAGVGRFQTERGGSLTAAGVGSSIVGLRADLLILDDPITSFEQAMSQTQLDKIWAWYETDARSRLLPTGKELMITTRWSKNDPAGRILAAVARGEEDWHVLRLPMLADSPHDPLGRELGEPLWPEWFGQHQIDQNIRDPLRWSALYQQVPLDESGSWVEANYVQVVQQHQVPQQLHYVVAIDLALSVGKGDYTVFTICGVCPRRNLYVVDIRRRQYTPDDAVLELFQIQQQYEPHEVLIDDDPAAKVFLSLVHSMARQRGKPVGLRALPLRGRDKETRAAAIRGLFMQGTVHVQAGRTWLPELLREIHEFPNGAHDDQVDCLSLIGRRYPALSAPRNTMPDTPLLEKVINYDPETGQTYIARSLNELFSDREQRVLFNRNRI